MTKNPNKNGANPIRDEKGKFIEGNPGSSGRPKGAGISITTEIKRKLQEIPEGKERTYLEYLIESILKKAVIEKDNQTIKHIWNYIDGLPTQRLKHSGQVTVNNVKNATTEELNKIAESGLSGAGEEGAGEEEAG